MFCYSPRRSSDVGDQKAVGMDVASWPSNMQKQPPLRFQQWPTSLPPRWWNHNIVVLHPCLWEINKEIELKEDEGSDFLFCSNPSILLDYTKQQRIPNNKKCWQQLAGGRESRMTESGVILVTLFVSTFPPIAREKHFESMKCIMNRFSYHISRVSNWYELIKTKQNTHDLEFEQP